MSEGMAVGPAPAASGPRLGSYLDTRAGRIAWAVIAISLVPLVMGVALQIGPGANGPRIAYGGAAPATWMALLVTLTTSISGAVIVSARPRHRLGWLLVSTALVGGVMTLGYGFVRAAPLGSPTAAVVAAILDAAVQPYLLAIASLILLWFPTGQLPQRTWWPVYVLIGIGAVMRAVEGLLVPTHAGVFPTVRPDIDVGALGGIVAWSISIGGLGFRVLQTTLLIGAGALVYRYRRADLTERRQITWVVGAGLIAFACSLPQAVVTVTEGTSATTYGWVTVLFFFGFSLIGPAILIAISRYRLYEIDRIVNRAVLYGLLTAIIAGSATAAVTLAQRLFVATTGQSSDVAIVLAVLVAASLYAPVRKRVEAAVDRRFKYDRPRFGAYRDALVATIELTRADAAAERLAREVRRELHAHGTAVTTGGGAIVASAGSWPCEVVARVAGGPSDWAVLVGPRDDEQPYPESMLHEVAEVISLVERAVTPRQGPAT